MQLPEGSMNLDAIKEMRSAIDNHQKNYYRIRKIDDPFWNDLLGLGDMVVADDEKEFPRDRVFTCPRCGEANLFTDYGRMMEVSCGKCGSMVFSRTREATVQPAGQKIPVKVKTLDDVSVSGRPLYLSDDGKDLARRLLDW